MTRVRPTQYRSLVRIFAPDSIAPAHHVAQLDQSGTVYWRSGTPVDQALVDQIHAALPVRRGTPADYLSDASKALKGAGITAMLVTLPK